MKNHKRDTIDRGEFLKRIGAGALLTSAALAGCKGSAIEQGSNPQEVPTDKMTYRTATRTGDKISLLGYG